MTDIDIQILDENFAQKRKDINRKIGQLRIHYENLKRVHEFEKNQLLTKGEKKQENPIKYPTKKSDSYIRYPAPVRQEKLAKRTNSGRSDKQPSVHRTTPTSSSSTEPDGRIE